MRARRLLASLLTTTLVGSTAAVLATATPAAAATETKIVNSDGKTMWMTRSSYREQPGPAMYSEDLRLSINVVDAGGASVYDGAIVVQRKLKGDKSWKTIAQPGSTYYYDSTKAKRNGQYRVLYSGSGEYAPAASTIKVKVQRNLNAKAVDRGRHVYMTGKVAPKYKGKKVVIQKKSRGWKTFRVVKTNKKSRFNVRIPGSRGGTVYRAIVKGSKQFATSKSKAWKVTTYYYRDAARTLS